jgi:5-methylcytosine-specific restriction endonuclease McrA/predicted small lipoprotein YifL
MSKYHITAKGEPGLCRAKHSCPLGDANSHYTTREEAAQAFEDTMIVNTIPKTRSKPRKTKNALTGMMLFATVSLAGCGLGDISNPPAQNSEPAIEQPQTTDEPTTFEEVKGKVKDRFDQFREDYLTPDTTEETSTTVSPTPVKTDVQETLRKLSELEVKGKAPKTGYDRDEFMSGSKWEKVRQGILRRDLTDITVDDKDQVRTGNLLDPYTGNVIQYERGGGPSVDVDHIVSLSNAWVSGIQYQSPEVREKFSTDPENLLAVSSSANRQKGDSNAAEWLPANKNYRCEMVTSQVTVKYTYNLSVTQPEHDMIRTVIDKNC